MRRPLLLIAALLIGLVAAPIAQGNIAGRLHHALQAAGVPIVGVSIGDPANKATWRVSPSSLQPAAQATIDGFNPDAPAIVTAERDAATDAAMDALADDLLTAILENLPAINADATAGTLKGNVSVWKQRIRARVKALRRAKGG